MCILQVLIRLKYQARRSHEQTARARSASASSQKQVSRLEHGRVDPRGAAMIASMPARDLSAILIFPLPTL